MKFVECEKKTDYTLLEFFFFAVKMMHNFEMHHFMQLVSTERSIKLQRTRLQNADIIQLQCTFFNSNNIFH